MAGTLSIPKLFAALITSNVSDIDLDHTTIRDYINNREVTLGTLGARPAASISGRWYFATDTLQLFVDTGSVWTTVADAPAGDFVKGLVMNRHASTATKVTFVSADKFVMIDANDKLFVVHSPATFDVDTSVAGPAAGGRDQAGAFSNGAEVHVYAIRNGATIAGTVSLTGPATGPVLPSGYTHWTYLASYKLVAATVNFPLHRARGAWVDYETPPNVLNAGTSTTEASVSVSTVVPSNNLGVYFEWLLNAGTPGGGGAGGVTATIRIISGTDWIQIIGSGTMPNSLPAGNYFGQTLVPVLSQSILYYVTATGGANVASLTANVIGYKVPNGGE